MYSSDDSPSDITSDFSGPKRIGRYLISAELGRGGMGVVYKAIDPNIGRTVAIKTIHLPPSGGKTPSDELVRRFQREARAAGALSHPNIVTIHDAGEDQGVFFIVMEYVEGHTLHELIARGPLPLERATSIVEDVGAALDYAHGRDVIHRDIKPANIIIAASGQAKVMDFGVAKMTDDLAGAGGQTVTGLIIGTPAYVSPESIQGKKIDGRADNFSLGVVLYEMLTGQRPFPGESMQSVIFLIAGSEPARATAVNTQLPPRVDAVLAKALAKSPEARYQTCAEMAADLRRRDTPAAAGIAGGVARGVAVPGIASPGIAVPGIVVPGIAAPGAAASRVPRHRSMAMPVAIVLLLALLGGGLWWQSRSHSQQPSPAKSVSPPPASSPTPGVSPPAPAVPDASSTAPDTSNPPGSEHGYIHAYSEPSGAKILIDGRADPLNRKTDVVLDLPAGSHDLTFTHKGHEPVKKTVQVVAGVHEDLHVRFP